MTYFPDLTPYSYGDHEMHHAVPTLNIGWLDVSQPYPVGDTSPTFVAKLFDFCLFENTVGHTKGLHACEFCAEVSYGLTVQRGGKSADLGNGEIRVIGKGVIYAAPTLIYHYVTVHQYQPPAEFVEAILTGPMPGSDEHIALVEKLLSN